MQLLMGTDPGSSLTSFPTLGECETFLEEGKANVRQQKLALLFTELSKELEAHPVVEEEVRSRFPASDFSSVSSLSRNAEGKMWRAYRRMSVALAGSKQYY